jgi:DnaJ-class molecular chaperone
MSQSAAEKLGRRVLAANPRQPFDVLGLQHGASLEDARRAYRQLAKELHPDKNGSALALEAFRLCGWATNMSPSQMHAHYVSLLHSVLEEAVSRVGPPDLQASEGPA